MHRLFTILLPMTLACLTACGDDESPPGGTDGGSRADTGPGADSGGTDGGGGGNDSGGGGTDAGPVMCMMARDCVWGEIGHEILAATDCPCLFGCPSLIQDRETQMRRQDQYDNLCTPGVDGNGDPCPVDDCIAPPPLTCTGGVCMLEPDAGP